MFISIRFMKGMVNKCRAVCFIASKWEEGIGGNIFYEKNSISGGENSISMEVKHILSGNIYFNLLW